MIVWYDSAMTTEINVTLADGSRLRLQPNTEVGSLLPSACSDAGFPLIAALVNNDVSSLSYPLTVNSNVKFLSTADPHGWRVYRNSLCFLLAKTVRDLYPEADLQVEHSFGLGIYCSFSQDGSGIAEDQIRRIEEQMRKTAALDLPIERRKISFTDAVKQFEVAGQTDKLNLLKYRNPPRIVVHWCEGFSDLAHGPLAPRTGVLNLFKLIPYKPGFVLHLPDRNNPLEIPPFQDQPHLFKIFQEHKEWGRILGVSTVGRLNQIIAAGDIEHFIMTAEALHEKKLAHIADTIAEEKNTLRLVLIAGPSSAGKTTFAKRLATHLTVNGIRPATINMDDYFVGREKTPTDKEGNPDFEHISAVDVELLNDHLLRLIEGKAVEIPHFNFKKGKREFRGSTLQIGNEQIILMEGIHGINPALTHMIPSECKFRIHISALTQLSVDSNNRISTTDNRLMRRMVRDHLFRGYSALETIRQWPSVRRGEKKWVFPFQRAANSTFNSALDYELAVLKPFVAPLLMQVKPSHAEYAEARRLSGFLLNFLDAPARAVPGTSVLREYIGGSALRY